MCTWSRRAACEMRAAKRREANLKNTEKCKTVVDGSTQMHEVHFYSVLKADHDVYWNLQHLVSRDNLYKIVNILRSFSFNSMQEKYLNFNFTLEFNPLNAELNPICYLLALLGAHHFLHFSRIRVKLLTLRRLMSYIYGAPILDVSRSHTTTQHSR